MEEFKIKLLMNCFFKSKSKNCMKEELTKSDNKQRLIRPNILDLLFIYLFTCILTFVHS